MRFVIDARYVHRRPSGIGNYVEALVRRLPGLAPDRRFHLWAHPDRPRVGAAAPNVTRTTVEAPADGLRTLLCPRLLDALRPDDVVHFPYSILGRRLPCPAVVTICDIMWLEHPGWVDARPVIRHVRQPYYQAGMRWAIRNATRLFTISQATADRITRLEPAAARRIVVTHLAAPESFGPAADAGAVAARAATLVGSSAPYYVVLGKNEPYKAHEVAMQAFAEAAEPHEQLVLVQRTHQGRGLRELSRQLGVADRVRWMPSLSEPELITLLQGAKALIQPSLYEGFGLPVVEAMACGCPVIASDTPALVEVAGGAALHAAVRSVTETALAIRRLRDRSLRDELRARGLERSRSFDWAETARLTLEVYRDVAGRGPRQAAS